MRYTTIITDSNVTSQSDSYAETLRELALELNVREDQLILEPDSVDGNQYENVFLYAHENPVAQIYTEEQYARIRS